MILAANGHATTLIGVPLEGQPWHTMLLNFGGKLALADWLADTAQPRLLNVRTAAGLPQTLEVKVETNGADYLLFGEVNAVEQARLAREVLALNHEQNNLTRELTLKNADLKLLNTKLEQSQVQLLQSEKMAAVGQLAAGVAHEINNPIGYVNSNLGTLKSHVEELLFLIDVYERCADANGTATDPALQAAREKADIGFLRDDVVALLAESRDGLERVRKIVQDLRDFSRIDSPDWQEADLNAGLESTLNVVWNELKHKAEVVKSYGELPPVRCHLGQVNQVFMNLLANAVQAFEDRGKITLSSGAEGPWAWVSVEDTGKGMTPEVMKRIFEPFFTTKPVGKGTGLGLSLAYDIVKKHGGRIDVSSQPGQGTSFKVWLPVAGPENPAA
ncbi:MAG: ATP-binding protein [Azonexus sp.]|nr:ATP-binding protein [Azonexus sp.]